MQTPRRPFPAIPAVPGRAARTVAAGALAAAMAAGTAGCAAPALDARVAADETPSACETAYGRAASLTETSVSASPVFQRYLSAREARNAWSTVATACGERFDEGVVRAAQAGARAAALAGSVGLAPGTAAGPGAPATVDFDDVVELALPDDAVERLALAEDRAGFATEVLAARQAPGATLAISDNHKAMAERLVSLAPAGGDPRRKVYETEELVAHPDRIEDPATGFDAPTTAVVEMDCARAWLDATRDAGGTSPATLGVLADAATARLWRALTLGYPAADWALFDATGDGTQ
ncbi:hypothetical protein H7U32_05400 [Bifidobacterium pullorum subsp. saeculare]|uniref:Lipoprotein n=1 Tax=Bifidobacterium pullorum subsp. saeculare TaxID=78257 RepID=A0A938WZ80_9BIFI|nr:hypothetical protein [Bifidobacterium pullorum]MBM6699758.1 hypothetical protein [Bifidobacterium pullorum subsp. saeculare]